MISVLRVAWPNTNVVYQSLTNFLAFIGQAVPALINTVPLDEEGFPTIKPSGKTYDEGWTSHRLRVKLSDLGLAMPPTARWCIEMNYKPAGQRPTRESLTDDDPVFVTHGPEADIKRWLENAEPLKLSDLPAMIEAYIAAQGQVTYASPPELVALGAPSTMTVPADPGGMMLFDPQNPLRRY